MEKVIFKIKRFQVGNHEQQKNHLTIIQISDLHFKFSFDWKYKRLIKKIKKINPDLLIITGDALDRSGRLAPLRKFLAKLPEQIPKVAVLGNHDYKSDVSNEKLIKTYSEYGVEHLVNQTKVFNFNYAKLAITGLDDFMEGADDFEKAFANIDGIKNHIILAHNPKHIDKLSPFLRRLNHLKKENEKIKPQLFLSGHTHGGQIKLASYTPGLPVNSGNYVEGWYHTGHGDLYINKGIGTSTIPVRLGARSELTIFDYYPVID
ncbi:MAG: metallophosphoesterase [Cyclobacteriaceae bacterium]